MATTEIEKAATQVPDLVRRPASDEITAEDVALPRFYVAQFTSQAVKDGLVKAGSLYSATGADDPDPIVLAEAGAKNAGVAIEDGVVFQILALRKGLSRQNAQGELELFDYNDPNAPEDAWRTYTYTIVLPEHDTDVPYKWLVTRSATPTAKAINTAIVKASNKPAWHTAFKLGTIYRKNTKGEWFVPRLTIVTAEQGWIDSADRLANMIAGTTADTNATGEEPAI